MKAERVTVHRSLDWSAFRDGHRPGVEVPYLPCHLWPLLLKNKHDCSSTRDSPELCSFPHAGHIDRHQRPIDPVLLLANTKAAAMTPKAALMPLSPRRNTSAPVGSAPELWRMLKGACMGAT